MLLIIQRLGRVWIWGRKKVGILWSIEERYNSIVAFKTSFYTIYLPVVLGIMLADGGNKNDKTLNLDSSNNSSQFNSSNQHSNSSNWSNSSSKIEKIALE